MISDDPAFRAPGGAEEQRALEVIRSALLDRIASGAIRHDGRVPPFAMAVAGIEAGISTGALQHALGELVAGGALLRAVQGRPGRPGEGRCALRFRDDNPDDLDRARAAVRQWRAGHPQGTAEQLVADLGGQFREDYEPVLRGILGALELYGDRPAPQPPGGRP